jgi:clan AA aspartic protease (TIGR02281 family)
MGREQARLYGGSMRRTLTVRFATIVFLAALAANPAKAEPPSADANPDTLFAPVYARLGITLPTNIAGDATVRPHLDELRREACDRVGIIALANALHKLGFRREAAESLYRFVNSCGGPDNALAMSTNIFLELSDFAKATEAADALVRAEPASSQAVYLRARALDQAGDHKRALDDYATTIELSAAKTNLSSTVFTNMAKAYATLGRFCEAMSPIQTWVAFDPAKRDTTPAQKLIADYASKGNCDVLQAKRPERFPLMGQTNVVRVAATINGTKGIFILDTGASFVSVQSNFAKRAKLPMEGTSKVTLSTANGPTTGFLSKADSIKLGGLSATNIPVVVQSSDGKLYGTAADGLLGMSFLARFDVQIAHGYMEVRPHAMNASSLH